MAGQWRWPDRGWLFDCGRTLVFTWFLQTRPANCELDGVGIVTILNKASGPELLLQKQYRPPIDKVVIEVPAGLIDAGETVEECAVRELKEEAGYVGVAEETSSVMYNGRLLLYSSKLHIGRALVIYGLRLWVELSH